MKLSERVRPISYLKTHAPEVVRSLGEGGGPVVITQRGEAKAVLQDIVSYERTQETLALLKILALGQRSVEAGRLSPLGEAFARVRRRVGTPGGA